MIPKACQSVPESEMCHDPRCREAGLVRRHSGGAWQYYLTMDIKGHPWIYAGRGLRSLNRSC